MVLATSTGVNTYAVTVRAGAGVLRELDFRELVNASVTIGNQSNKMTPFVYQPSTYGSQIQFGITRLNVTVPWTVRFVVTDDCGTWNTLIGAGSKSTAMGAEVPVDVPVLVTP